MDIGDRAARLAGGGRCATRVGGASQTGGQSPPTPGLPLRCLLLPLACVVAMAVIAGRAQAQSEAPSNVNREYAIKAAYLYQFSRYVQWPAEAFTNERSPLVIGVLGTDPFGGVLDEIARTKQIDGRPIAVRRFATMTDYTTCNILFVTASVDQEQKAAAIRKSRRAPILLVGEDPGFAERGGTINFIQHENHIRFEINVKVAKEAQLKISSKLLSLAKIVGR
jgi:hypothetical protein